MVNDLGRLIGNAPVLVDLVTQKNLNEIGKAMAIDISVIPRTSAGSVLQNFF